MATSPGPKPEQAAEVDRLRREAKQARAKSTQVNRAAWGVAIGVMIYGAVNVTLLLVDHDVPWLIAPLLSLMVDLGLCVALWSAPILAEYGRRSGWVTVLRLFTALMSWGLNAARPALRVAESGQADPDWVGVGLHSCGPLLLLVVAEAAAALQRTLASIVNELDEKTAKAEHAAQAAAAAERAATRTGRVSAHVTPAAPLTTSRAEPSAVSPPLADDRPAPLTTTPAERSPLTGSGALTPSSTSGRPAEATGHVDQVEVARDAEAHRPGLHLVTPPTPHTPHTGGPSQRTSAQASADETTDETTDEMDPETRMRAFWDRETAAGRVPTGAELARVGQVSPATGKRRRAAWEAELPEQLRGGGVDVASA